MDVIMKSASSSLIPDVVKNPNMPCLSSPSITRCEIRTVLNKRPLRDPSPSSTMDITTPTHTKPLFLIPAPSLRWYLCRQCTRETGRARTTSSFS
ncbi:unnamed protein product, partial [Arabidopsis halleri]